MKKGIELVYTNNYKRRCYLVLAGFMVDYEEQVLITGIKTNMQYLICHILPKKKRVSNPIMKTADPSVNLKLA